MLRRANYDEMICQRAEARVTRRSAPCACYAPLRYDDTKMLLCCHATRAIGVYEQRWRVRRAAQKADAKRALRY